MVKKLVLLISIFCINGLVQAPCKISDEMVKKVKNARHQAQMKSIAHDITVQKDLLKSCIETARKENSGRLTPRTFQAVEDGSTEISTARNGLSGKRARTDKEKEDEKKSKHAPLLRTTCTTIADLVRQNQSDETRVSAKEAYDILVDVNKQESDRRSKIAWDNAIKEQKGKTSTTASAGASSSSVAKAMEDRAS